MSGTTPLQQGGSNSVTIQKANLPNVKLKVDSFSAVISEHFHYLSTNQKCDNTGFTQNQYISYFAGPGESDINAWYRFQGTNTIANFGKSSNSGGGNTGIISPTTENLGNGTAITIQPQYITLKFWKRLT